jgi:hypothetical protein
VFSKLMTSDLKMNFRGIGCAAHILHNVLRTSADMKMAVFWVVAPCSLVEVYQ